MTSTRRTTAELSEPAQKPSTPRTYLHLAPVISAIRFTRTRAAPKERPLWPFPNTGDQWWESWTKRGKKKSPVWHIYSEMLTQEDRLRRKESEEAKADSAETGTTSAHSLKRSRDSIVLLTTKHPSKKGAGTCEGRWQRAPGRDARPRPFRTCALMISFIPQEHGPLAMARHSKSLVFTRTPSWYLYTTSDRQMLIQVFERQKIGHALEIQR